MSRRLRAVPAPPRFRGATRLVLVLMVAALLVGCGKKGNPIPPPDEKNTFPRTYPNPNPNPNPDAAPPR